MQKHIELDTFRHYDSVWSSVTVMKYSHADGPYTIVDSNNFNVLESDKVEFVASGFDTLSVGRLSADRFFLGTGAVDRNVSLR